VDESLASLREAVIRFRDARDWAQFHRPKDLLLGLVAEVGELAEILLWKTEAEVEASLRDPTFRARLGEEMADVLTFLLYLSEAAGLDLAAALRAKIEANARKYPVEKSRGSAAKYTDLP
jgi:NTP pyrophosphatase (non-canonical NTP hydrolase)